jgi:hypothetical protein
LVPLTNYLIIGGGSGIRTRDTVSRIHTFQACAFNHSATPPSPRLRRVAIRRPITIGAHYNQQGIQRKRSAGPHNSVEFAV